MNATSADFERDGQRDETGNPILIRELGWEDRRGTASMWLFIITEAMLFVALLFSYFYLGAHQAQWPTDPPPKLLLAVLMLVALATGSAVMEWGRTQLRARRDSMTRIALAITALMGIVYVVLQYYGFLQRLQTLRPDEDAYSSIFYTITTFDAAHVVLAVLMVIYVLILPRRVAVDRPPHRPYENVTIFWHFVTIAWAFVLAILYIAPNIAVPHG